MRLTRRRLLGGIVAGATVGVAGCGCEPFPGITIAPSGNTRVGRVGGTWVVDGAVVAEFTSVDGTVPEVQAVVSDPQRRELARRDLGTFDSEDAEENDDRCVGDLLSRELRLEVGNYPYRIALETPALRECSTDPTVYAAEFNDYYDPGHAGRLDEYWKFEEIPCSETTTGGTDAQTREGRGTATGSAVTTTR